MADSLEEAMRNATAQASTPETRADRSASKLKGGKAKKEDAASVNFFNSAGNIVQEDLRAKIKVPLSYLNSDAIKGSPGSQELFESGGIIFPYTPYISYTASADYQGMNPVHSNYTQYFYKGSKISEIQVNARYTVQSAKDAAVWIATKHLLSSLTKMRFGIDSDSGSPPPICRLFAYGDYMIKNVPVVVQTFRIELAEDVDYYNLGKPFTSPTSSASEEESESSPSNSAYTNLFGQSFVPTVSKFSIVCLPVYSRREILNSGTSQFLEEHRNNSKYL
jgi:hypothetical protein